MARQLFSVSHGILTMLSKSEFRTGEIVLCFPTLESSSTLTEMRRKGLIAKDPGPTTNPWKITKTGREILADLDSYIAGPYSAKEYWERTWGCRDRYRFAQLSFTKSGKVSESKLPWEQADVFFEERVIAQQNNPWPC